MSYFLAFAGFAALIILHELGHFTAAKAVGMRVERFSLFFPPHFWKVRRGETEYAIGTIPLGGYVKISGMSPHEDLPEEVERRAYLQMPVWKRVVVIAAGPFDEHHDRADHLRRAVPVRGDERADEQGRLAREERGGGGRAAQRATSSSRSTA